MASLSSHRRAQRGTLFVVLRLVMALALALMALPALNASAYADDASTDPVVSAESPETDPALPDPGDTTDPVPSAPEAEEPVVEEPAAPPAAEEPAPDTTEPAKAPSKTLTRTGGTTSGLVEPTVLVTAALTGADLTSANYIVADEDGPNDEPGQKDLTQFFGFTAAAGSVKIGWSWDEIAWSGNNTGDACALFDTDNDGKANYAVCVTVTGDPATQLDSVDNPSPRLYSCNDTRVDRCAGPTLIASGEASSVDCEVAQTSTDPFATGDEHPQDTSALCTIPLSLFSGSPQLINVCSYPSQEPNSDPSDCVLVPRDALLTVTKVVTPPAAADGTLFGFTFSGAGAPPAFSLLAGASTNIPVRSESALSLSEDATAGWTLVSATCSNGQAPGALNLASGANVTCTFTNTRNASVTVNKSWVINGTSYTNATKPADYSAVLSITGQESPSFGTSYGGYSSGDIVTIGERVTVPDGCTNVVSGGGLGTKTLAGGSNVYSVTNTVTCPATVQVDKSWVINGTSYTNASKPAGYTATLSLSGQVDPAFGAPYGGYVQGQNVTIGESVTVPEGCTNTPSGDTGQHTLAKGANVYTITNTVTCDSSVRVNKTWVINGVTYNQGDTIPGGYTATLFLTGQVNPTFGTTYDDYTQGDDVTISELANVPEGCTNTPSGDTGAHTLAKGANVYTITNTVRCAATVTVNKTWVINGVTYNQGDTIPTGYTASLTLTKQQSPEFGETYTGYIQGETVSIGETAVVPDGCANDATGTGSKTLAKGANVYTITNTVTCDSSVRVNKTWVINGVTYNQGDTIPGGYTATLFLTGQVNPTFGTTYDDYTQGDDVTISELANVPEGCTNTPSGDTGAHTLAKGANVYTITNTVRCAATVTVNKTWVINGQQYANGSQPAGHTATLSLTKQENPSFGATYSDYLQGEQISVGELVNLPEGCTNAPTGDIGTKTLAKGANVYTITNTVTCAATVQIIKSWVVNGTAYTNANKPSFVSASLGLTGQADPAFGTTYAGYTQGGTVTISESVAVPSDCANVAAGTGSRVLNRGANVFTVTNTVTCPPAWDLAKSSDPASGSTVTPGETVTYTLHASNTSHGVVAGATVTDNLVDVLDNASLAEPLASGLSITGTTLTWAVPTMAPGGSASISYTVTVSAGQWNQTLRNVVTPNGSGGSCDEPGDCSTEHFTPAWSLVKSSEPPAGSTVIPGESVTYTLTATNTSQAMLEGASAADDLSDVLDNATLAEPLAAGLSLSGTTLTWAVPTLAPGDEATVSYTVTVSADQWDQALRNLVTPTNLGGECDEAGDCTTEHFTPAWELTKVSDPVSGSEVETGDSITYTLRAVNTSDAVVEGATAEDDLSEVLNNATLDETSLPDELTLSGTLLTWAVPTLAPGGEASVSYTVTVDTDAFNVILENVVVPVGAGGVCVEADDCTTTHDTPEILGEEVVKPRPRPPVVLGGELPDTGAPRSGTLIGLLGSLTVGLGALLMSADRRRRQQLHR